MKISVKKLLLLIVFICIGCTGSAYATPGVSITSVAPQKIMPYEESVITAKVVDSAGPVQGAYVKISGEHAPIISGYTDASGTFTGVYKGTYCPDYQKLPLRGSSNPQYTHDLGASARATYNGEDCFYSVDQYIGVYNILYTASCSIDSSDLVSGKQYNINIHCVDQKNNPVEGVWYFSYLMGKETDVRTDSQGNAKITFTAPEVEKITDSSLIVGDIWTSDHPTDPTAVVYQTPVRISPKESTRVVVLDMSFSPQPPFWPSQQVTVTSSVEPAQSGVYVQLQSELGGYFAEGYTDSNGKFIGTYTVPDNALEWVKSSATGGIRFSAYCPEAGIQSGDISCEIIPEPAEEPEPVAISQSFSPQPPFFPGEQVTVIASVEPAQSGVHVQLQCEGVGFYAEGYTDDNGKFTGTFTCPSDALELAKSSSNPGGLYFSAVCPTAQSIDTYCNIVASGTVPSGPQIPEFPSLVLPVTALLGLVFIFGRRKM